MLPELRWLPSFATTCLHAADGVCRGWQIADPRLAELAEPAKALGEEITSLGLPPDRTWQLLCANAHDFDSSRQLAKVVAAKAIGPGYKAEQAIAPLAGRIADVEAAVRRAMPDLIAQLELRIRPIQEQWDARGPGLMRLIGKLTDERLIVESADVLLVHPVFGGAGVAHLQRNSVRLEAVLANPHPELPEVVRLAWLLAQLQCDLPIFSEAFSADRLPIVSRLALLPPVLAVAEELELVRNAPELLIKAVDAWRVEAPTDVNLGVILPAWWQTVQDSRPSWTVALTALEQMLVCTG